MNPRPFGIEPESTALDHSATSTFLQISTFAYFHSTFVHFIYKYLKFLDFIYFKHWLITLIFIFFIFMPFFNKIIVLFFNRWFLYINLLKWFINLNINAVFFMVMVIMIRGIKSSFVKLILDQINFAYIVSISFLAFQKQNPFR